MLPFQKRTDSIITHHTQFFVLIGYVNHTRHFIQPYDWILNYDWLVENQVSIIGTKFDPKTMLATSIHLMIG